VFRRNLGRLAFVRHALDARMCSTLQRRTDAHIAAGRKQLVVFAFDAVSHAVNWDGIYERDELDTLFAWLRERKIDTKSATAIDIGAYIGNHSLYFADHFKSVLSFEPNPRAYEVLRLNAALAANIACFNIGLSDRVGEAILCVGSGNMGASYIAQPPAPNGQPIRLTTLDSMDLREDVKLIKVDVEGHELQALTGARELIRRNRPIVVFEQHTADFEDGRSAVIALLEALGYQRFATIRRYPRVQGSLFRRALFVPLLRTLLGESIEIRIEDDIEPGFYSSIVALPSWMRLS
jgi:FkbM family methyltransferase